MNLIVPILALSTATFMMVTLPTFFRNILPRLGSRVQYRDGLYYVAVRNVGEWHEIREFITPHAPEVQALYSQIGPSVDGSFQWVTSQVEYRYDIGEFFQFPVETINTRRGDCEDSAILLASLIKNFSNAHVILGSYQGWGHAWVTTGGGEILEATYSQARAVPDPDNYKGLVAFNDVDVIESYPGALSEVFNIRRNEEVKLNLMAAWA